MSKTADIISCLVSGSLLAGIGWLFVTVLQLPPPPVEDTSLFTVDAETYNPRRDDNVDRMIICSGGGGDDYEPQGPTMLAGEPVHGC
jgi:hypothetical protein